MINLSLPLRQKLIFFALVVMVAFATHHLYLHFNTKWIIYRQAEDSFKQRQWVKAAHLYEESLSQGVVRPMALMRIGDAYMQINEYDKAIYWYRRYIADQPHQPWAHRSLAQALTAKGDFENASKEYQEVFSSPSANKSEAK